MILSHSAISEPLPADEESAATGTPAETWAIVPDPITDGSAVLQHDGYDAQLWEEAQRDYGRLRETVSRAAPTLVTAPALLRDLFFSFYKRVVQPLPLVPLTPAHQLNNDSGGGGGGGGGGSTGIFP